MEIQELWRVLRQRWRVVVVVTLICVCLSLSWSLGGPVSYKAQGRIMISTSGSLGTASDALDGEQVSVDRAPTYAQLLRGPEVAARASQKLHGVISAQTIQNSIDARINSRQPMITVTATSPSASDALQMVSAAELGLQQYVLEIERPGRDGSMTGVVLSGDIPTVTRLGSPVTDAVLAALLGMVLGSILAVYRDRTDPIVKSVGQLGGAGLTYRGTIKADDEPSALRESFRRLAVACAVTGEYNTARILVVGVDSDCESRFVARGFATGLVACGREVTVVDTVSKRSSRGPGGLSEVVDGSREWAECRTPTESEHLWEMNIGTRGDLLPTLLIDSKDTKRRLASYVEEHVVVAAPSIVHSALAVALTSVVHASLVVVRQGRSLTSDVIEAKMTLEAMGVPAVGIVVLTGEVPEPPAERLRGDLADAVLRPGGEVDPAATHGKA